MSKKETIEMLVDGGKAKADASVAQKLGPMKINVQEVLKVVNEKTSSFNGMKVPVKLIVDTETKEFEISIGTPPISELIKKELELQKGSSFPNKDKVANIGIEQVIKIAKMKESSILHNSMKSVVKTVIGSCNALGILVEGEEARDINKEIDNGKYDKEIKEERKEVSEDKKKRLQTELEQFRKKYAGDIEILKAKVKEKAKAATERKEKEGGEKKEETAAQKK
ncbi:50S ribosomal protein L11 [Candidatus Woesearchaeota archaeon]|nr:50S ribosomal protein L11 [Candidatus Woesearchaeota archaeon]